jgi:hypothetical protein
MKPIVKVRIGKNLYNEFPVQNGLKQGDALSLLLLNFASEMPSERSKKMRKDC